MRVFHVRLLNVFRLLFMAPENIASDQNAKLNHLNQTLRSRCCKRAGYREAIMAQALLALLKSGFRFVARCDVANCNVMQTKQTNVVYMALPGRKNTN